MKTNVIAERPFCKLWLISTLKQEQVQICLNLVVALASAELAFLSGIDAFEPKVRRQLVIIEYLPFDIQKSFVCLFVSLKKSIIISLANRKKPWPTNKPVTVKKEFLHSTLHVGTSESRSQFVTTNWLK